DFRITSPHAPSKTWEENGQLSNKQGEGPSSARPSSRAARGALLPAIRSFRARAFLFGLSRRRLERLEQLRHLDAQPQRDAVERLDGGTVLAQLDLRQVAQRHARALRHLRQRQAEGLAALADGSAERLA